MIVVHRLIKHETMRFYTLVSVEKIKDTDTGGKHTLIDDPILFDYNKGLGFTNENVDPLHEWRKKTESIQILTPNKLFDEQN